MRFTAKSILIVFIVGLLCVALSRPGVSLGSRGFANTSVPAGCAGKIPFLPHNTSHHSGSPCTSGQLFNVLSRGLAPGVPHGAAQQIDQLWVAVIPVDGPHEIASLEYPFYIRSFTYPLQAIPIYLLDSVLTL